MLCAEEPLRIFSFAAVSLFFVIYSHGAAQSIPEKAALPKDKLAPPAKKSTGKTISGIRSGDGGPFGAVIVKDGKVIGRGHNRVLAEHDPTMHGEVAAIRDACRNTGSHNLSGCVLYTTAYPCPMCMGAAMWANVDKIVYGCTAHDTAEIGFRDEDFYDALRSGKEIIPMTCEDREDCLELFDEYVKLRGKRY